MNPKKKKDQGDSIIARKRLNSDDKYDNKEYIEKMEAQLEKMFRKQFPVDEGDHNQSD
jgi:hypothetical protein